MRFPLKLPGKTRRLHFELQASRCGALGFEHRRDRARNRFFPFRRDLYTLQRKKFRENLVHSVTLGGPAVPGTSRPSSAGAPTTWRTGTTPAQIGSA